MANQFGYSVQFTDKPEMWTADGYAVVTDGYGNLAVVVNLISPSGAVVPTQQTGPSAIVKSITQLANNSGLYTINLNQSWIQLEDANIETVIPAPSLLSSFGALAHSTLTNTGNTVITGDLGLYPGTSVTGFPPGLVSGAEHITDGAAAAGQDAALAQFTSGNALPGGTTIAGGAYANGADIGPGVYKATSSLALSGTITLDGYGDPNATWYFQIGSTLVSASSTVVQLANGAQAQNVFWLVGSSATLGTSTTLVGNVIANVSITDDGGSTVVGRLAALTAAVTLNDTTITVPGLGPAFLAVQQNGDTVGNASFGPGLPAGPQGVTFTTRVPMTGAVGILPQGAGVRFSLRLKRSSA